MSHQQPLPRNAQIPEQKAEISEQVSFFVKQILADEMKKKNEKTE